MHKIQPRYLPWLLLLGLTALTACTNDIDTPDTAVVNVPVTDTGFNGKAPMPQTQAWEKIKPGCQDECPRFSASTLTFSTDAKLTTALEQGLLELAYSTETAGDGPQSLTGYADAFLEEADIRDESMLNASIRYQNEDFTVIELQAYYYPTGAAHGMSSTRFLNWDNRQQQTVSLADMLLDDAASKFSTRLQAAHAAWLDSVLEAGDSREDWLNMWPFHEDDNLALTAGGAVIKYGSYAIAPYAFGHPELLIPYGDLVEVFNPYYLPSP